MRNVEERQAVLNLYNNTQSASTNSLKAPQDVQIEDRSRNQDMEEKDITEDPKQGAADNEDPVVHQASGMFPPIGNPHSNQIGPDKNNMDY